MREMVPFLFILSHLAAASPTAQLQLHIADCALYWTTYSCITLVVVHQGMTEHYFSMTDQMWSLLVA